MRNVCIVNLAASIYAVMSPQGYCTSRTHRSTHLPLVWPRLESQTQCHACTVCGWSFCFALNLFSKLSLLSTKTCISTVDISTSHSS